MPEPSTPRALGTPLIETLEEAVGIIEEYRNSAEGVKNTGRLDKVLADLRAHCTSQRRKRVWNRIADAKVSHG